MPPAPSSETISYGPSLVPGVRFIVHPGERVSSLAAMQVGGQFRVAAEFFGYFAKKFKIEPPPVSTPARVASGKRRIIIRLPAQARGISEPRISNNDKVGSLQPSGQNRFKSPDRARLGEAYRRFPERRFQSINAVAAEKLADVGNSATVYSVLVEVE